MDATGCFLLFLFAEKCSFIASFCVQQKFCWFVCVYSVHKYWLCSCLSLYRSCCDLTWPGLTCKCYIGVVDESRLARGPSQSNVLQHVSWMYFLLVVVNICFTVNTLLMQLHCTTAHVNSPFLGLLWWASTRKVKPIWILLKQETMSGSGISWAICKSAPRSRQITMPSPHHSDFYRLDALPAAQPTASKHWSIIHLRSACNVNCSQSGQWSWW